MNVPNSLSMLRILLVPVFTAIFLSDSADAYFYAVTVFLFAGLTDVLDGIIARKYNLITRLGRILDPLADKLMILSALFCVSIKGLLPWWITLIYLVKEIFQILCGVLFFRELNDVPTSNIIGKGATITFYIAMAVLILFDRVSYTLKISLFVIAFFFGLSAFALYYRNGMKIAAERRKFQE